MDIQHWYRYDDQAIIRFLKDFIAKEKQQGNKTSVAALAAKLNLKFNTLYYLFNKYNLKNK